MSDRLPSFVVIGAAKAATTWIAHQLRQRPDVFMPGPEPHFFSRVYDRGPRWYAGLFADATPAQVVGEKSADYLACPEAPSRMASLLPEARIVVQLRNPVERAYSDYCMLFRRGQVGGDVGLYLDRRRTPEPRFLDDGLYARHLRRYLDEFPADQIKVILMEEVRSRPATVLADVCRHVRITPAPPGEDIGRRLNDSTAALAPLPLRRLPRPVKQALTPLRNLPGAASVRSLIAKRVTYPPLHPDLRQRLSDFYRRDVEDLEALIGHDLREWVDALAVAS